MATARIYWYYKVDGIDGSIVDEGVKGGIEDPMGWAMSFVSPTGVMAGVVDVTVHDDGDTFRVVVTGKFRSLGEPMKRFAMAEWYVEESEITWA